MRDSIRFLPIVFKRLKKGGTIHLYSIMETGKLEEGVKNIMELAAKGGREVQGVKQREIKSTSPATKFIAFDLQVL